MVIAGKKLNSLIIDTNFYIKFRYDCTSSNFDGMVAACQMEDSWVAKWQRIQNFKPGVYAMSVSGRLPPTVIRDMRSANITYRSRDTSKR